FFSFFFFFFSSRRRHTRFDCDWSSDVCSSDLRRRPAKPGADRIRWLGGELPDPRVVPGPALQLSRIHGREPRRPRLEPVLRPARSEERRVGKECRSRWTPEYRKKKISIYNISK